MKKLLASTAIALAVSPAFGYFNDFEGPVGNEWSSTTTSQTPIGSRSFLGEFSNDSVSLTLNTTVGETYSIAFELFVLKSWDGNTSGVGPDTFILSVGGVNQSDTTLLETTFSNTNETGSLQAYSAANPNGSFAAYTDADEIDTLGYTFYGDSVYKFGGGTNPSFSFVADSSTTIVNFLGTGLQGVSDESWGLDNVSVSAVPEPATMGLLALGAIAALKRRKN